MTNKNRLNRSLSGCKDYLVSHLTEQSLYSGWVIRYSSFSAIASSKLTLNQLLQNSIRLEVFSLNRYILVLVLLTLIFLVEHTGILRGLLASAFATERLYRILV